jgi:mono/diheme cytochrome c family protein
MWTVDAGCRYPVEVLRLAFLGAVLMAGAPGPAAAQDIGDAKAGRLLAQTWCAGCHVVDPASGRAASTAAPGFQEIANMPSTTAMALRVFLQTPHGQMPDLQLSRNETDNVIAYVLGFRAARSP